MVRRELNIWLAFADVTFVLFLCALVASAAWTKEAHEAKEKSRKSDDAARASLAKVTMLEATNATLAKRLATIERNRFSCDQVDPLLDRLSACIYTRLGRMNAVGRDICSVTVSEDLVQFETGSDRPTDPRRAEALAQCFSESARWFEQEHFGALYAIETVHIDGFTDCVGDDIDNAHLGADRALEVYRLLVQRARRENQTGSLWLRKVAVRSFGERRPTSESPCPREIDFRNDRRVRFAVDMRLRHASSE